MGESPTEMSVSRRSILVESGESRLDQYLAKQELGLTRSRLRQLIDSGDVLVNGAAVKPAHRVRPGDRVVVSVPPPRPAVAVAQDIPLTVVYQDADLVVIDKPAGLAAHPGPGHPDRTLVNGLLALCPDIQGIGGEIRPWHSPPPRQRHLRPDDRRQEPKTPTTGCPARLKTGRSKKAISL